MHSKALGHQFSPGNKPEKIPNRNPDQYPEQIPTIEPNGNPIPNPNNSTPEPQEPNTNVREIF